MEAAFFILVLIFSIILHEVAHGYMANYLGDPTARLQGRLTLNPIPHIDPLGTIILPAILILTQSPFFIGYAKPVPYNPYNISNRYGELLVAGAGPAINLFLAVLFGLIIRFLSIPVGSDLFEAFTTIVIVNLWLMIFNLIPLPPLDGSKILSGILPGALGDAYDWFRNMVEQSGLFGGLVLVLLAFYFVLAPILVTALGYLFALLTGVPI